MKITKQDVLAACDLLEAHPDRHLKASRIQIINRRACYCPFGLAIALKLAKHGPFSISDVRNATITERFYRRVYNANDPYDLSVLESLAAVRRAVKAYR